MDTSVTTDGRAVPWKKASCLARSLQSNCKRAGPSEFGCSWTIERASSHCSISPSTASRAGAPSQAAVKSCRVRASRNPRCKTLPCLRPNGHRSHACDYADKADQGSGGEILSQKCNANGDSDGNPKVSLRCGGHRP
jgi:hypothetical protein